MAARVFYDLLIEENTLCSICLCKCRNASPKDADLEAGQPTGGLVT